MKLKKGQKLKLDIYYHEHDLEATASLTWSRSGGIFVPIQADWQGEASWKRTTQCFTYRGNATYVIDFKRPMTTHTIKSYPVQLSKDAKITLLGCKGELPWTQKEFGDLTIDLGGIDPDELDKLDHAWVFRIDNWK